MRRTIVLVISVLISIAFLYIGLSGIKLDEVWTYVQRAQYLWLIPGVAVYFLAVWGRTWRWHYLLRPIRSIPLGKLFPIVVIGYMGNNVYPFRAGEVIRAYVLQRNQDVKITASLATIIVERLFDGLVMLLFVFIALPFANIEQDWLRVTVTGGTIVFLTALVIFLVLATQPTRARSLYTGVANVLLPIRFRAGVLKIADSFMEGLESLRSPKDLIMTFTTSIFIWLTEVVKYWFVTHAFGFEVSFFVLMLMAGVVNLATTLPAAPGYVGTFDTPGIATLTAFGVAPEIATGYTLVLHAALWLPITLLGGYYLVREGLGWRSFADAEQVVNAEKAATT